MLREEKEQEQHSIAEIEARLRPRPFSLELGEETFDNNERRFEHRTESSERTLPAEPIRAHGPSPLRSKTPPTYTAKSRREFVEFIDHCELTFSLFPTSYKDERTKAFWASQYIQGRARDD
jgi:hypothetical protein